MQHSEGMGLAVIKREIALLAGHVSDVMPLVGSPPSKAADTTSSASLLPLAGIAAGCWGLIAWAVISVF